MALTYFMVYLVRQGCTSWLIFYLLEVKGATSAAAAALTVSGAFGFFMFYLGGVAGWFWVKAGVCLHVGCM